MLSGVIEVDNQCRLWEVHLCHVLDPLRAVSQNDDLFRLGQAPADGFSIDSPTEVLCRFNRSNEAGRIGITHGKSLGICCCLGKNTTQFRLTSFCRSIGLFPSRPEFF
jgi:hypothetical protein